MDRSTNKLDGRVRRRAHPSALLALLVLASNCSTHPSANWKWSEKLEDEFFYAIENTVDGTVPRVQLRGLLKPGRQIEIYGSDGPMQLNNGEPVPRGSKLLLRASQPNEMLEILEAMRAGPARQVEHGREVASARFCICLYDSTTRSYARLVTIARDRPDSIWEVTTGSGAGVEPAPYLRPLLTSLHQ